MKTLLSLFDYSGNWAYPFARAGWNVILWDIKHTQDMFSTFSDVEQACADFFYENIFDNYGTIDGIIAAVPCTDFAVSGARWWKDKDASGQTDKSIELVWQTLRIIDLCMPDFWCVENPVGRLNSLVPYLADYGPKYFQPYHYGDPYTKKTGLWGEFNFPEPTDIVEPKIYTNSKGKRGSYMWAKLGGKSDKTKELRSVTPKGFAEAFYVANSLNKAVKKYIVSGRNVKYGICEIDVRAENKLEAKLIAQNDYELIEINAVEEYEG
jgi:hypothetical protein